uniref:Exosome component 7 n=1 Tax=Petromyzon marinus TaxID=7757 RepID=S4RYT0_PETMA
MAALLMLSEAEKAFIVHGVQDGVRGDGRGCEDFRVVELETEVVSNTSGSARLRLGQTDVLVGVKAELGSPRLDCPDEGYLEFFVDCTTSSANATPEFEGRGGEDLSLEISSALQRSFAHAGCLDLRSLCILPRQQCWVLYVDVLLLEYGGNVFDAASIAVKAALFNTRIPTVHVSEDEEGVREIELSDDPYDCVRLEVARVPCIVTLSKIGQRHVVDASLEETCCCRASLMVSVTAAGAITGLRKAGPGSLHPDSVCHMIETGKRVGVSLHKALDAVLQHEESQGTKREKVGFLG